MIRCIAIAFSVFASVSASPAADPIPPNNSIAELQRDLARREYSLSAAGADEFHAVNRAQDLRLNFRVGGVSIEPRSPSGVAYAMELAFRGIGRCAEDGSVAIAAIEDVAPTVSGNRAEFHREGVVEWYVNDASGLEQGFTLQDAPVGAHEDGSVVLELTSRGVAPHMADDGAVEFRTDGKTVLRYDHLVVIDAERRVLPATLSVVGSAVRITVDDRDATYPLIVDPLVTNPTWTAEGNQVDARFGHSVSSAGDVNGDSYADVIVGAFLFDNGQVNEGMAFVYLGSPTGLQSVPSWTAESDQAESYFGGSVASLGDVNNDGYDDVIVGAQHADNGHVNEGRAFVYLGSATGLGATPAWTGEANQSEAYFGGSVASAGDVNGDGYIDALIGAFGYEFGDAGKIFIYRGHAGGIAPSPAWSKAGETSLIEFGYSVDGVGDVDGDGFDDVLASAPRYGNFSVEGRAYLYKGAAAWAGIALAWTAEGAAPSSFGFSLAGAGDINGDGYADVVVGAPMHKNFEGNSGRAFSYHGSAAGLVNGTSWNGPSVYFAQTVAGAGDIDADGYSDVLVGSHNQPTTFQFAGRAYAYRGSPGGVVTPAMWTYAGTTLLESVGESVAAAGDVDGDGFGDVIVGAPGFSNGDQNEGRAMLFPGRCHATASAQAYGVGKPGSNGVPTLASTPPVLGGVTTLSITGGLPNASPCFLFGGPAPAALPFDGGTLLVIPALMITLPALDAGGALSIPIALPQSASACGVAFYLQAGFVDAGAAGPYHTALTQGLVWNLGS